jgi:hypothetical protein
MPEPPCADARAPPLFMVGMVVMVVMAVMVGDVLNGDDPPPASLAPASRAAVARFDAASGWSVAIAAWSIVPLLAGFWPASADACAELAGSDMSAEPSELCAGLASRSSSRSNPLNI